MFNNTRKNILFVSIAFPPKADAEGLQVAKYIKYIIRKSKDTFNIDVVTSKVPTLNIPYDPSLVSVSNGVRQQVDLTVFENKYLNFVLRKIFPFIIELPDAKYSFHLQSFLVPNILNEKPDLIYSRSFPISSSVMAFKLKKHYNIPWIMHLSDPWADYPLVKWSKLSKIYNENIEKKCFEIADVICFPSRGMVKFYKKKYHHLNKRIEYIPNVFDKDNINENYSSCNSYKKKIKIFYTGTLSYGRNIDPLLKAISLLSGEQKENIEVVIIGYADAKNRKIINHYKVNWLTYMGTMEYKKTLELQKDADFFLLIDAPVMDERNFFFPSKILDYLLSGRPILALTSKNSETQNIIESNNFGFCVENNNIDGIKFYLELFLSRRFFKKNKLPLEYCAEYNSNRLLEIFHELLY